MPSANVIPVISGNQVVVNTAGTSGATKWRMDWGDLSTTGDVGSPPDNIAHNYLDEGNYNIRLTIWDKRGRTYTRSFPVLIVRNPAVTAPAIPNPLNSALISNTQINLSWANVANETGYQLEIQIDGGAFNKRDQIPFNTTSYSDLQVTAGHTYTYRLQAFNAGGFSGYTNTTSQTTGGAVTDFGGYRPQLYTTYGMNTPAGRGPGGGVVPVIIRVNTRNDTGASLTLVGGSGTTNNPFVYTGELRAAVNFNGARFVIIEVSGYINLNSEFGSQPLPPYMTLAAQTAPSPGVTVRNYGFLATGMGHTIFQHLRIRPGKFSASCTDGATVWSGSHDVVMDHCSISWGKDENMVFIPGEGNSNFTFWRSITSENLYHPVGCDEDGHGILFYGGTVNVAMIQSLTAHNQQRNPFVEAGVNCVLLNNIVYNWNKDWGYFFSSRSDWGVADRRFFATAIGTAFVRGPATMTDVAPGDTGFMFYYDGGGVAGCQIYRSDNIKVNDPDNKIVDQAFVIGYDPNVGAPPANAQLPSGYIALAASSWQTTLTRLGARPLDRDAVDVRVVNDAINQTSSMGDWYPQDENDVGGYPALANNSQTYIIPANPFSVAPGQTVRTNLEMDLEAKALALEP